MRHQALSSNGITTRILRQLDSAPAGQFAGYAFAGDGIAPKRSIAKGETSIDPGSPPAIDATSSPVMAASVRPRCWCPKAAMIEGALASRPIAGNESGSVGRHPIHIGASSGTCSGPINS